MGRKGRSQWFASRASNSGQEADSHSLAERRRDLGEDCHWDSIGPFNIAGRSTSLVVDPDNTRRIVLGSAGGGVWESLDSGLKWTYIWDPRLTQNIGSVALDPGNSSRIYVGTGEANLTLDSYPGTGLYCRYGTGKWINIGTAGGPSPQLPTRIGTIAVDPFDPGHILIGSATNVDGEISGMYEGRQGEDLKWEWSPVPSFDLGGDFIGPAPADSKAHPYRCHCVLFHPEEKDLVFATVNLRGWRSGIWCRRGDSRKDGRWMQPGRGLPPPEYFGRTSLAISASDPNVIWAYAAHRRDQVLGVFVSRDLGHSWHSVGQNHFYKESSADYVNCIAIHPEDSDCVICGGVDLHRTKDGGKNWEQVTEWNLEPKDPHYAHADHHALAVLPDGSIYDANDAGMAFGKSFGDTWKSRSAGLVTTMFYDLDVSGRKAEHISGGAQDNGTLVHSPENRKGYFKKVRGGDGGWTVYNPDISDGKLLWGSSQYVNIAVSTDGFFSNVTPEDLTPEEKDSTWLSFIAIDTSPDRVGSRPVFFGTTRIWRTYDEGSNWYAVSPHLDASTVTAIEVADHNPRYVFAATESGGVFRSLDGGNTWSENLAGIDLPYGLITRIESKPNNHQHLLLTIGATARLGDREAARLSEQKLFHSHIYISLDAGRNWSNADPDRKLPDLPYNCVTFETSAPFRAFVATDMGVFCGRWSDQKQQYSWSPMCGDLPNVMVTDIVYHHKTKTLTAATYGRGIFRLALKDLKEPKSPKGASRK